MDDKNQPDIQCEEQLTLRPEEPDVKQALITRRESLTKDIESLTETISQTEVEYAANLEKLRNKKGALEEALKHVIALLRFEGCVPGIDQSDNLIEVNDAQPISLTDAAYELLTGLHEPLHYKEITLKLQEKDIRVPGKDAAATLLSRISRDGRFKRTKRRGVYALSTWRVRGTGRKKTSKSRKMKKSAR